MRSASLGRNISVTEVSNISKHGFWLLLDGEELFLSFENFPWFREATVAALTNVERPGATRLRWPDLDIDLTIESIRTPEAFPLVSRLRG